MMGVTHACFGAVVGLASVDLVPAGPGQVAWVCAWAGAAVLPDWDHPQALAARMWGPLTGVPCRLISRVAGGHRWGTHDAVLAPAGFGLLAGLGLLWWPVELTVVAVLVGLLLRLAGVGRGLAGSIGNLVLSWAGAWWLAWSGGLDLVGSLLPVAVAGGVLVHVLTDAVTEAMVPVPIVWVWRRSRMGLPVLRTGRWVERLVVVPAVGVTGVLLVWRVIGFAGGQELARLFARLVGSG